jgi:uncharacterized tellurite resistance protein B-like protein
MGWTVHELSMREIQQMSADETLWHEAYNKENLDSAFTLAENQRLNKERMPVWETRRKWREGVTREETEKARIAGDQFATRFPQFERSLQNAELMVVYMREHDLDATQIQSYISAFREMSAEGRLTLVEPESASEFLHNHVELRDQRIPPLIAARNAKAEQTQKYFEQAASATNQGSVARVVDYPQEQRGVPPQPDKASFRMKVRSMSAAEIAQRCQDDLAFRKALDELK